jgi:hypothetical protein
MWIEPRLEDQLDGAAVAGASDGRGHASVSSESSSTADGLPLAPA